MKKAFISSLILGIAVTAGFSGGYLMPQVVQAAETVQNSSYTLGKSYTKPLEGYRRYPSENPNVTYKTVASLSIRGNGSKPFYAVRNIQSGEIKFSFCGKSLVLLDM